MKRTPCISALVLTIFFLNACTCAKLGKFKDHSDNQDYSWIASQDFSCQASDECCNQLHLVKGDACYRLAKAKQNEKDNYRCAVRELEIGIAQTKQWEVDHLNLNRAQVYENLCESIRNLQDLETGAAAEQLAQKLLATSQTFLSLEPGNLAAVYYLSSAKFSLLRPCVLHPENCPTLCQNLKAIDTELERSMPDAVQTKYRENFRRLHLDIDGAKRSLAECH